MRHILDIMKESKVARRLVLPVLSKIGRRDTTISHHYTGDLVRLNCFKHRNYWYMGRRREEDTIALVEKIVRPGDTCFDVGANIGYISLILARIADAGGRVFAFEPDPNNLVYLRQNVGKKTNVSIIEAGVGAEAGTLELYTEDLTGQNSSFIRDFDQLSVNAASAGVRAKVRPVTVPVVNLDEFVHERNLSPSFIKIDVEGFELEVLHGASVLMRDHGPVLVVEVHERQENQQSVFDYLDGAGYRIFDVSTLLTLCKPQQLRANVLCLRPDLHADILERLHHAKGSTVR